LRANIAKLDQFVQTELPEVKFIAPQAGYLAWLDCRAFNLTDAELEQKFVAAGLVPSMGIAFGKEGSGFVRLNLGCPTGTLDEALVRIKHALN
jgi:cystathionine beta-lyase